MRRKYFVGIMAVVATICVVLSTVAQAAAPSESSDALKIAAVSEPTHTVQGSDRAPRVPAAVLFVAAVRAYGPHVARQYGPSVVNAVVAAVTNRIWLAGTDSRIHTHDDGQINVDVIFDR